MACTYQSNSPPLSPVLLPINIAPFLTLLLTYLTCLFLVILMGPLNHLSELPINFNSISSGARHYFLEPVRSKFAMWTPSQRPSCPTHINLPLWNQDLGFSRAIWFSVPDYLIIWGWWILITVYRRLDVFVVLMDQRAVNVLQIAQLILQALEFSRCQDTS